jgi:hypothetical protein
LLVEGKLWSWEEKVEKLKKSCEVEKKRSQSWRKICEIEEKIA